jgi:hypothetical protein
MKITAQEAIVKRKELWEPEHDIAQDRDYCECLALKLVSEDGTELRNQCYENPEYLIEMFFTVVDKDLKTVPFFMNKVQKRLMESINKAIAEYKVGARLKIFFMILKGRQQGMTVFISAYQLAHVMIRTNFSGYTLADSGENARAIFYEKGKFVLSKVPDLIKPTENISNVREFITEVINTKWRVATASEEDTGRSKMINFFHGSEAALWPSIEGIMSGLGNALVSGSIVILESTAKGINQFKKLWDDEENNFEKLFFAWWDSPEYAFEFEDGTVAERFKKSVLEAVDKSWSDSNDMRWVLFRCRWLVEEIGLEWSQVYWYYMKWRDSKALIKQEFPCTAEEAFVATTESVYKNVDAIYTRIQRLTELYKKTPTTRGDFEIVWRDPIAKDKILSFKWVANPTGKITIYEHPTYGHPYVLGGDTRGPGQGIVKRRDYYSASVKDNSNGRRVATFHSNSICSADYTAQMYCLGSWYNRALIAIEVNIDQYPVIKLGELGYHNLYVRRVYDTFTGATRETFGWMTDGNNRPAIITQHVELVEQCIELFPDIAMLKEMITFVDGDRRYDHLSGEHDDMIFADMIAQEASKSYRKSIVDAPASQPKRLIDQLAPSYRKEVRR